MRRLWLRRILAAAVLAAMVTLWVTELPGAVKALGWLPSWQLVPAILAGSALVLAALAVITLLFGRVYCSVICPLGVAQDISRWLAKTVLRISGGGSSRAIAVAGFRLRYLVIALFLPALAFGFGFLIDPYAIFARFMTFVAGDTATMPPALAIFAVTFFAAIVIAAAIDARWWCNAVCPVGALLSLFQRFAVFRLRIDNSKCVGCDRCVKACDKGVIPTGKGKLLDHSRCVSCYACAGSCQAGALSFGRNFKSSNPFVKQENGQS